MKILFLISFFLLTNFVNAQIIYNKTWATGDLPQSGTVNLSSLCLSTNPTAAYITDSFNNGQNWIRFETRLADSLCPAVGSAKRSEVSIFQADAAMVNGEWFQWRTQYPAWQPNDPTPEAIGQYHHPALAKTGPPVFEIWSENGLLYAATTFDSTESGTPMETHSLIGAMNKGVTDEWLLYYHRSITSDGITRLYRNGLLVFERYGANANMYNGTLEPTGFFKIGIYKWVNGSSNVNVRSKQGSRVVYSGYLKVGNSSATYETFYPATTTPITPVSGVKGLFKL